MKLLSTRWLLVAALVFAVGVGLWLLHETGSSPELSAPLQSAAPVPAQARLEPPPSGPPVVAAVPPPAPPKRPTPPVTALSTPPPVTALPPAQPGPPGASAAPPSASPPVPASPKPEQNAPAAEPAIDAGGGRGVAAVRPPAGRSLADILDGVDLANPAARVEVAAKIKEQQTERKTAAWAEAEKLGLPKRIEEPGGRIIELMEIRDGQPIYNATNNANAAISAATTPLRSAPYSLSGAGGTVGVWDGGAVRSTHQELTGRVTVVNSSAPLSDHATHVAGTIGASGVQAAAQGMSPATAIRSFDWNSDFAEMLTEGAATAAEVGKISLSNHSYGIISGYTYGDTGWSWYGNNTTATGVEDDFGRYDGSYTRDLDAVAYALPYYLPFWAAGNDRTDVPTSGNSVRNNATGTNFTYTPGSSPPGDGAYRSGYECASFSSLAKNVLTVGAVNDAVSGANRSVAAATMSSFSSWGPTDDGRIKPDLVANGVNLYSSLSGGDASYANYSGTSMATPSACGSAALLVALWRQQFFGENLRASTLKALLIHTANDVGTAGPDYQNGWGLMNTQAAADVILAHKNSPGSPRILEGTITAGATTVNHQFQWDGTSPIRATLCWTDPAGTAQTAHDARTATLVHNLDLTLIGPTNITTQPYVMPFVGTWTAASMAAAAVTGKNNVDNVEQVLLSAPVAGTYTARVVLDGTLTKAAQNYSLILSGNQVVAGNTRIVNLSGDLGFGSVATGSTATRQLTIRNLGNQPLAITALGLPAGFTGNFSGSIASGGTQLVNVTFAPTQLQSYAGTATVNSNATGGIGTIAVSGTGIAAVAALTNNVPVSNLSAAQNGELVYKITVPANQASLVISITGGTGDADLYVRQGALPTTATWDYRPYLGGNEETATITNPAAGDWFLMIRAYSAFAGVTVRAVYAPPGTPTRVIRLTGDLAFGNLPAGGTLQRTLTISNDGNTALAVSGLSYPAGFSGAWSGSIAAGGSQDVAVTFAPTAVQTYSGLVTVTSDKTAGTATAGISGTGVSDVTPLQNGVPTVPLNAVASSEIHFRITVPAGQSSLQIAIAGGTGDADLYVRFGQKPTLTTYDYRPFVGGNAETVSVPSPAAGDWYVMVQGFSQYTGVTLTATYSGAGAVTRIVRLAGTLDFAAVRVSESATQTLTIFNDGNAPLTVSSITYPAGFTGAWAGTVQPGAAQNVTVTFTPAAAQSYAGSLTVNSNATSGTATRAMAGVGTTSATPLANGVAVTALSGAKENLRIYALTVPAGATNLTITLAGGTGDADLYVRHQAVPTLLDYDYAPFVAGNNETVFASSPGSGVWYIMLHAYASYAGVTLTASYSTGGLSLGTALDWPALTWIPFGDAGWFGQTGTTRDGVDAVQSEDVFNSETASVGAVITGPGTLRFWWRVSSEPTYDYLRMQVDEVEQARISGTTVTAWAQRTVSIGPGIHLIQWDYVKDGSVTAGSDAGWVDQVTFTGSNADLASLLLSAGSLSPAFSASALSYAATVAYGTNALTFTPALADPAATVKVNGVTVAPGAASNALPLNVGSNTITALVTAQDGTTQRSYTVVVTRQTYYASWAAAQGVVGTGSGSGEDYDGDGATNFLEMAFGTNPTLTTGGQITVVGGVITQRGSPALSFANLANGVDYRIVFGRRKDHAAAGLIYRAEFSADLTEPWETSLTLPTVLADDGVIEAVSVPFPLFVNGRKARFSRVTVSGP